MNNLTALEKIEQCHGSFIERLIWFAGSASNTETLQEFLEEMPLSSLIDMFPGIKSDDTIQWLIDNNKFGLFAEVHIPIHYGFTFNDAGQPQSSSFSNGRLRIFCVYGETLEELTQQIEEGANLEYTIMVEEFKNGVQNEA